MDLLGTAPGSDKSNSSLQIGIADETDPLRTVMVWGPVGVEAYLAQLYPESVSLFLDSMDPLAARQEADQFGTTLERHGIEVIRARDIIARLLSPSSETRQSIITQLLT